MRPAAVNLPREMRAIDPPAMHAAPTHGFETVEALDGALRQAGYVPDRGLSVSIFLSLVMGRPLLLEGPAGIGKSEVAMALGRMLDSEVIRLQCYEGLDANHALYEWDYTRQLLHARLRESIRSHAAQSPHIELEEAEQALYSERFLLERPLLRALRIGERAVLLIDDLDRSDDEFEAFLLEFLADFTITVPELGTIRAESTPAVVVTSNRTRELHDAIKRRCLFHWMGYPSPSREAEIIGVHIPTIDEVLAADVAAAVGRLRELDLLKPPGSGEAIDWARALVLLGAEGVDDERALEALGWLVKSSEDLELARSALSR